MVIIDLQVQLQRQVQLEICISNENSWVKIQTEVLSSRAVTFCTWPTTWVANLTCLNSSPTNPTHLSAYPTRSAWSLHTKTSKSLPFTSSFSIITMLEWSEKFMIWNFSSAMVFHKLLQHDNHARMKWKIHDMNFQFRCGLRAAWRCAWWDLLAVSVYTWCASTWAWPSSAWP